MKNILEMIFNIVFSFGMLSALMVSSFLYFTIYQIDKQHAQQNICYSQNMVRVNTDAGPRCALPNALVEIK